MIVNMIGPTAVGKSTFAQWFIEKYPNWAHLSIDVFRKEAALQAQLEKKVEPNRRNLSTILVEDRAWFTFKQAVVRSRDCIIESTGNLWRLRDIYNPADTHGNIYTIRFAASTEECEERALQRARVMPQPYDADEASMVWCSNIPIPANLVVDLTGLDNPAILYSDIEWHIIKAKMAFEATGVCSSYMS